MLLILVAPAGDAISIPRRTVPMPIDWRGVYAAATTEFHADESLDPVATKRHFERLI